MYSIILLKQVEHSIILLKVLWHSQLAITFSPSILEFFWLSNIHQLLAPFNFMMVSEPASSDTAANPSTVDGMVWLLIHDDDDHPEDKQFSFL